MRSATARPRPEKRGLPWVCLLLGLLLVPAGARGASVVFNHTRGFYEAPFLLELSSPDPDAEIYYSLDGSAPSTTASVAYEAAIPIEGTSIVRAIALAEGSPPSKIETHTFLFVADVVKQSTAARPGPGWPATSAIQYGMDPDVVNDAKYTTRVVDALLSIPTLSFVTDIGHFFNADTGIYVNPGERGDGWERPLSVEYFTPDGSAEFQVDAGIRIHGADARGHPKKPFRLYFRSEYGTSKLHFPLIEGATVNEFDQLVVRPGAHDSWLVPYGPGLTQATSASYIRDEFMRRSQDATGHPSLHGRFVHLYINGQYWGMHNLTERPNADFAADRMGGTDAEWDVIKGNNNAKEVLDGTAEAWNKMLLLANAGRTSETAYQEALQYLDVDDFIDFMIARIWAGDTDFLHSNNEPQTGDRNKNWYAMRRRTEEGRFQFFVWDAEICMGKDHEAMRQIDQNLTDMDAPDSPGILYIHLRAQPDFRLRFADRLYRHLFHQGPLTQKACEQRWLDLATQIERPLVAESARWGDTVRAEPFTPDVEWAAEINWMVDTFFAERNEIVIEQFREIGLYPEVAPPIFYAGGYYRFGGRIAPSESFQIATAAQLRKTLVPTGATWRYLDDGSDQGEAWRQPDFDDSAWPSGPAQLGTHDTQADEKTIVNSGPPDDPFATTYFRHSFDATDLRAFDALTLRLLRDDGAVVYLNGQELLRDNMPEGPIDYRTSANLPVMFDLQQTFYEHKRLTTDLLRNGENVLAVEVHQRGASTDISFDLGLEAGLLTPGQIAETVYYCLDGQDPRLPDGSLRPTGVLAYTAPTHLTETAWIKARTLQDGKWSALAEARFFLHEPAARGNLAISEIHYNPTAPTIRERNAGFTDKDDFEFIELMNIARETIDLSWVRFAGGIAFEFATTTTRSLAPGARLVLVRNRAAFDFRYGEGLPVAGAYSGGLANDGERLLLVDANGKTILDFEYNDNAPWPAEADGEGYSLELRDPKAALPRDYSQAEFWKASADLGGSPGRGMDSIDPCSLWILF